MSEPRILIYDIETAPNLGYVWAKWDQNVHEFEREWYILCFAYKWLGEDEINVVAQTDFPKKFKKDRFDDFDVVKALHELFDEADIVIAHNGINFDQRRANARFLLYGFDPPSPYKAIDTLLISRRYFGFNSHKLDDLGRVLGFGRKIETNFSLWLGCMAGDPESWALMIEYNIHDVELLENVYFALRPWVDGHPNVAAIAGRPEACPKCGVEGKMQSRGVKRHRVTTVRQFQCQSCGGWAYNRLPIKTADKPTYVN